ncbi:MAG: DNA gyrase C-terminal beta-propeller domain-containing protein [Chloroflexota bacterium]
MERPDLIGVVADVQAYISFLEAELEKLRGKGKEAAPKAPEPTEPPTPLNVITLTRKGVAKRTPRHFYGRQRRSGMGVFDLEASEADPPRLLAVIDENEAVLLFSNFGRAFRVPVAKFVETAVRGRGDLVSLPLQAHERIVAALPAVPPANADGFIALVSQRGWVRRVKAGYFGKGLIQGMTFHDVKEGGHLTAVCWTPGDGDLFVATKNGKGIRFSEHHVSRRGCLGIRVAPGEETMAITAVRADSGVFMATNEGKGTIRLMSGFSANKAPGAGGKVAMKTEALIGATAVSNSDDIFIISQLGKMIRFQAGEVPAKTGVVQGVNCMTLRNDEALAFTATAAG